MLMHLLFYKGVHELRGTNSACCSRKTKMLGFDDNDDEEEGGG